ncbi:MAG: NAD(P)/FAD-dependent oxidoreductase [Acidobacteriota bacterium]
MTAHVVIVGAGLAGLRCAGLLQESGVSVRLLEAEAEPGGRVRTFERDGFLLDRGFQVLNTAYPEARRAFDLEALDLRSFEPGALVHRDGGLHLVSDPFRRPTAALQSLISPIGGLGDKLRVARLRHHVVRTPGRRLLEGEETSTEAHLQSLGFSPAMIDRFFRSFFGGVFLERRLETSSRWFELLFRQFSLGASTLPRRGMGQLSRQLADRLSAETLQCGQRVVEVGGSHVLLESGERIEASAVVLAVEEPAACALLGEPAPERWRSVACLYYDAPSPPERRPILMLEGEPTADQSPRVNNVCVPSQVSSDYAPQGRSLVSVTALDEDAKDEQVRPVLTQWFGEQVDDWRLLEEQSIRYALPLQTPGEFQRPRLRCRHGSGVFVAGDALETASIHGALVSGRKTARSVLEALGVREEVAS